MRKIYNKGQDEKTSFLMNSALISAALPLDLAPLALSCSGFETKQVSKQCTPDELGMYSFVEIAPDGKHY